MPKVTVVIPTYNSAKYIVPTGESVLAQTYPDYELIVVDDGSTDNTRQLSQPYLARMTYIYQENKKYSGARNRGIRAASGDYIAFLDSDDIWLPDKLAEQVAVMDQHPEVTLVHCSASYIDADGAPVLFKGNRTKGEAGGTGPIIADQAGALFTFDATITTSTVMVRHSTLKEVGPFDPEHIHGEDWELWVRLASKGPLAYIPKVMAKYRVFGWQKILKAESSEAWVSDQFRTIERATALWQGDRQQLERLRAEGTAKIYTRAALANYQLGQTEAGRRYLEKAIAALPELAGRERLQQLAVDWATLIENDAGAYEKAETFIRTFYANLPAAVSQFKRDDKESLAWFYIGNAFKAREANNPAAVRRLLRKAIFQSPGILRNRGIISLAIEAWLGKTLADSLRRGDADVSNSQERAANAQS